MHRVCSGRGRVKVVIDLFLTVVKKQGVCLKIKYFNKWGAPCGGDLFVVWRWIYMAVNRGEGVPGIVEETGCFVF